MEITKSNDLNLKAIRQEIIYTTLEFHEMHHFMITDYSCCCNSYLSWSRSFSQLDNTACDSGSSYNWKRRRRINIKHTHMYVHTHTHTQTHKHLKKVLLTKTSHAIWVERIQAFSTPASMQGYIYMFIQSSVL